MSPIWRNLKGEIYDDSYGQGIAGANQWIRSRG